MTAADAIRRQAIDAHGETWRLLELPARTPEEDAAMDAAARRSLDLWKKVGTGLNEQRGGWLVARVQVGLGRSEPALDFALRSLQLTETHRALLEDFHFAFAEEIAARAFALAGDLARAAAHRERANALGSTIAEMAIGGNSSASSAVARGSG